MSHQSDLIATDIDAYLAQHEHKELLRLLTCGSVDDGKSTLIGRLLYDSKMIYEDQLAAVRKDSTVHGTTGGDFDPALLTDGLKAEREQGITIDVAYRYFSTAKRKFIIADTPGHEQYTRNMATGASTCDLAIILIDARHGVLTQTKRHSFIVSLLGIKHVLVAINKMDLVEYSESRFEEIKDDYNSFAIRLGIPDIHFVPIVALDGDNLVERSSRMPWYQGTTLMNHLENVEVASDRNLQDFRLPIQFVNRPHLDFRGYCGTIASGIVRSGDQVMALPSRKTSRVQRIITPAGELPEAFAPMAVTVTLEDEIDVSRGDMLVPLGNVPRVEEKLEATLVWMSEEPLVAGKPYLFKHSAKTVAGTISTLRYRIDVNTLHRQDAPTLMLNEIGRCTVSLNENIAFDPYRRNRGTGAFIIVDRIQNVTVGAGMILDRASGEAPQDLWDAEPGKKVSLGFSQVTHEQREARFGQRAATLFLTGLTGAGKTTLAYAVERRLFDLGRAAAVIDGQNLRAGISKDLAFTARDRSENVRRGAEMARMYNDSGLIAICSFLAPSASVREKAREAVGKDRFLEIYLTAPIEVCRQRDEKGMYLAADAGELSDFPGVSAAYDVPQAPDLALSTDKMSLEECVEQIVSLLESRKIVS